MQNHKPIGNNIVAGEVGEMATIVGIDAGPNVTLAALNDDALVLHIGGHGYWSGIGMKSYTSSQYHVYRVIKKETNTSSGLSYAGPYWYTVKPLITFYASGKKRKEGDL